MTPEKPASAVSFHQRLRLRLFASQFVVAFVGVALMLLATRIIILSSAPNTIRPLLVELLNNPALLGQTEARLILAFRNAVILSVAVAAIGAILAGLLSSYILWRTLIVPLRQVTASSGRIAQGRYNERVSVPENSGVNMARLVINFNRMAEALEEVEQQRVALLGNISHELRTPLTGLKGYLEGLQDGLFPGDEETYGWMLLEVERLNRLVDDIHRLSRAESGQSPLHRQSFDVASLAQRVAEQLSPQAQEAGVDLGSHAPGGELLVYADPDRTAQVLINLVDNALRYTPAGGAVSINISQAGGFAQVAVVDTGAGIPPDALPFLFERFYRVDHSRARASGGSGIGLTISRHLVRAMGGELTAASQGVGHGSAFTFTLPLSA